MDIVRDVNEADANFFDGRIKYHESPLFRLQSSAQQYNQFI